MKLGNKLLIAKLIASEWCSWGFFPKKTKNIGGDGIGIVVIAPGLPCWPRFVIQCNALQNGVIAQYQAVIGTLDESNH